MTANCSWKKTGRLVEKISNNIWICQCPHPRSCPCPCPSAHVHVHVHVPDRDMDMDVNMGRFLQLNFRGFIICTQCLIVFSKNNIILNTFPYFRHFVTETFCYRRHFVKKTFYRGDVLLRRRFVRRRFVEETFCKETFCMCVVLQTYTI